MNTSISPIELELANFFMIEHQKKNPHKIFSTTNVNKLLYFIYAWYGAEKNIAIYDMEAWKYGPVVNKETYLHIKAMKEKVSQYGIKAIPIPTLSSDLIELAEEIFEEYSECGKQELFHITHNEPGFKEVESFVKDDKQNVKYNNDTVFKYYSTILDFS